MAIVNKKIENIYPLTPMQEGIIFHDSMDKGSSAYIIQTIFSLKREADKELLKKALKLITKQYDILNTFFVAEKVKEPCQVLLTARESGFECIDMHSENKDDSFEMLLKKDVQKGFDLQNEPLLRVKYVELKNNKRMIVFTNHHIILDGWCTGIIFNNFFEYYEKLENGENYDDLIRIAEETRKRSKPYSKYVKWILHQNKIKGAEYWKYLLEEYESIADIKPIGKTLPTDEQVKEETAELTQELTDKLKAAAERSECTVSTAIETAIGLMMQEYSQSRDVVFGKVVSGRNADIAGIENMVGLFINTIPVRVKCCKDTYVNQLLKCQQQQAIASSKFDYLSLAEIQSNTLQGKDLIKVLYVYENYDSSGNTAKRNDLFEFENVREQTNYSITITGAEVDGRLKLGIMYDPSLYCGQEIKLILDRLILIISEISIDTDRNVSSINCINQEEREIILKEFNKRHKKHKDFNTITKMFEEQVYKTPKKNAVIFGKEKITYSELNTKANRIANKLREMGVGRNDLVALFSDRNTNMVCSIYGIIKSGAAYVAIDPEYPNENIKYIIDDCKPKAILTNTQKNIEYISGIPIIDVEISNNVDVSAENPKHISEAEDLVYCIYTSGTSGKPKGVMIEHKSLFSYTKQFCEYYNIDGKTIMLGQAYIGFDTSIEELYPALINGGSIVIVTKEQLLDLTILKKFL